MDPERLELHVCSVRPCLEEDGLEELPAHVSWHHLDLPLEAPGYTRAVLPFRFARVLGSVRPDVVWTISGVAWISAPAVVIHRTKRRLIEVFDPPSSRRLHTATYAIERFLARWVGYEMLVHTTAVESEVRRELAGRGMVHRTSLAVEPVPTADGGAFRRRWGIPADAMVVLYVARLVRSKRVDRFVATARALTLVRDDVWFVLCGGGGGLADARAATTDQAVKGRLVVTGAVPDLAPAYQAADVFLSTSDYEGFGLAIGEAMTAGVAVVSTDAGGVTDLVIDDVTGVLVGPGRVSELVAVRDLLADGARRRRLAAAGQSHVLERFGAAAELAGFHQTLDPQSPE